MRFFINFFPHLHHGKAIAVKSPVFFQGLVLHIDVEAYSDGAGSFVSMPDANTIAFGAPYNDGNGIGAGHVRIYSGVYTGMPQNDVANTLVNYPNPTDGNLTLDLGSVYSNITFIVRNELGQEVNKQLFHNTSKLQVTIMEEAGIYFIEVNADCKTFVLKAIKE